MFCLAEEHERFGAEDFSSRNVCMIGISSIFLFSLLPLASSGAIGTGAQDASSPTSPVDPLVDVLSASMGRR